GSVLRIGWDRVALGARPEPETHRHCRCLRALDLDHGCPRLGAERHATTGERGEWIEAMRREADELLRQLAEIPLTLGPEVEHGVIIGVPNDPRKQRRERRAVGQPERLEGLGRQWYQ